MRARTPAALVCAGLVAVAGLVMGASPAGTAGTWLRGGDLSAARSGLAAAMLGDGRLVVTGGSSGDAILATVDLLDDTGATPAAPMHTARTRHQALSLADGRVLVVGGRTADGATGTMEVFDGIAWTEIGSLVEARWDATATQLPDGRVLVAGGETPSGVLASLELVDVTAGTATSAGALADARARHAAAIGAGRVVLAGGSDGAGALDSIEVFDPVSGTVVSGGRLHEARSGLTATTLLDGWVFIAGGAGTAGPLATTELFDASATVVVAGPVATVGRSGHLASRLPDNNGVLLVGGTTAEGPTTSAEIYLPWRNEIWPTGSLGAARSSAAGAPLLQAGVLTVAGGRDASDDEASIESYGFATLRTDRDDYAPDEVVTITGAGWQPGETVHLVLQEVTPEHADRVIEAVADAEGRILDTSFAPEHHHIGVRFLLTAVGVAAQAQLTFTDAPKVGAVTIGAQTPAPVTAGSTASYLVTVSRGSGSGSSGNVSLDFSFAGLPAGATTSFSPTDLTLRPQDTTRAWTLSVAVPANAPAGSSNVTIRAAASANDYAEATASLAVSSACTPPSITSPPGALTRTVGEPAGFSVSASGTSPLAYAWRRDGSSVGTDTSSLTIASVTTADAGAYDVVVSNACGSATSDSVALTVVKATPTLSWSSPAAIEYGTPLGPTQLSASSSVPGAMVYTPAAGTVLGAGSGQLLSVTFTPDDSANYTTATATVLIDVAKRAITVTADPASKVYGDDDPALTFRVTSGGLAGSDAFSGALTRVPGQDVGSYDILQGSLAAGPNYDLTFVPAQLSIGPRPIDAVVTVHDKVYDGTIDATIATLALDGVLGDDGVTLNGGTASFDDKHVGTGKTVAVTGLSLGGEDAGNYVLASPSVSTTASIAPRALVVEVAVADRAYDGTTAASVTLSDDRIAGDVFTLTHIGASFDTKYVGVGKLVTVTGIAAEGLDAGNYVVPASALGSADVTPRALLVSADASDKKYDGTPVATVVLSDNRISGDLLTPGFASATFAEANAGTWVVTVSGITISGPDAVNYSAHPTATTMATILRREITIVPDPKSKSFGMPDPALTYAFTGDALLPGDGFSGSLERDPGEAVGAYEIRLGTLGVSPNYSLTAATGVMLTITPWKLTGFYQPVTMAASAAPLVYNTVKGGSTVPFKFNVYRSEGGTEITTVAAANPMFVASMVGCSAGAAEDAVEVAFTTTGGTSLRYDATAGQFIQNWQTPKGAGVCYVVTMSTADGSRLSAYFKTK